MLLLTELKLIRKAVQLLLIQYNKIDFQITEDTPKTNSIKRKNDPTMDSNVFISLVHLIISTSLLCIALLLISSSIRFWKPTIQIPIRKTCLLFVGGFTLYTLITGAVPRAAAVLSGFVFLIAAGLLLATWVAKLIWKK